MATIIEDIHSGSGDGYGSSDGSGSGSGYGDGDGYGYGSGDGIKSINGNKIYIIDSIQTIITSIRGNIAKGFILMSDLILNPCFIAKVGDCFAHGDTIKKALEDARNKLFEDMDEEERIELFWEEFISGIKYPANKFFDWHNKLTGSCEMGRMQFAKEHNINLETAEFTVEEFVELTKDSYRGDIIRKLKGDK
jgi:hypothetical protein